MTRPPSSCQRSTAALPGFPLQGAFTALALTAFLSLFTICTASAQTLFTYGKHAVSREEFLRAYNKNSGNSTASFLSYKEYLDLYAKFKLKVQAALDADLDTTADQVSDLETFRYQLAETFLKEDASINLMVDEAMNRSLKDIHLSYILVPVPPRAAPAEVSALEARINTVYASLQRGVPFGEAAGSYGVHDLGYITVFVLPYVFENAAYSTPPGKFSAPFRSPRGFVIIRNNAERKAAGVVRVAQILLAFPPDTNAQTRPTLAARADSLYTALEAGASFSELAGKFSDDTHSYQAGGEVPAFGVGMYDTVFQKNAFALEQDGDISKPFETSFGYHILRRLQRIPVIEDPANKDWKTLMREKVLASDRMEEARAMLIRNIRETIRQDAPPQVLSSDSAVLEFYRKNLEKYNTEFAEQLNDFRQGNLLFGIMQQKVWNAAPEDSAALYNYYLGHKDSYFWENSADALIVTCTGIASMKTIQAVLQENPASWKRLADGHEGLIQIDSGRFELNQLPVPAGTAFSEGIMTAPLTNDQDSSVTFVDILSLHHDREPKGYEEAKGAVINDYQGYLEEQWINELKKKYPIRVKKNVFKRLP